MTEFNPNCGKCGMLNSRGFCSLTACRYPSNVIVAAPKVIRSMMVNPQIEKPMTHFDEIKDMSVEELAEWICQCMIDCCGCPAFDKCVKYDGDANERSKTAPGLVDWLKSPVEVEE